MAERPSSSPWGKIQRCKTEYPGVFGVSTEGHGGIMVNAKIADELLSPAAIKCGFKERGFICFEEDCQAAVVIKEMLDKNIWQIPKYFTDGKDKYIEMINSSLIRWNPEYWEAIGNTLPLEILEKRLMARLDENLKEHADAFLIRFREIGEDAINENLQHATAVNNAFSYLTKNHKFEESEIQYLLKFQNPLLVVADCVEQRLNEVQEDFSGIIWDICDKQDALQSGEYPLINDIQGNKASVTHEKSNKTSLLAKVKENQDIIKNKSENSTKTKKENEFLE